MAEYTFFFNPMSRAQIARWALHEAKADYEQVFVPWDAKPQALLDANPLGKLPTIIHHQGGQDHAVSEGAAVCHYLAEMSAPDMLPTSAAEKAAYFRWMFFAAGPLEQAVTARAMGWSEGDRQVMVGFGTYDRTMDALDQWLSTHDYVCGERFTMADVYVGSQVWWGLEFGSMPDRGSFKAYRDRVRARPAADEAAAIDNKLIAEMQAQQGSNTQ